jgi:predicted DCC family thiol-disulfide oxidoreductase YuxK
MVMKQEDWQIEVYYDGDCPLCRREIDWVRKRDGESKIRFVDISDPNFDAEAVTGKTFFDLMARLHARTRDGEWITGIEVTRQMFAAIGFRRSVQMSRWPVIRNLLDWSYQIFAKNRLWITGRGPLAECVECRVGEVQNQNQT